MHPPISKTSEHFQAKNVVLVGDCGMIKSPQQRKLSEMDFDFITALIKKQIEKLIEESVIRYAPTKFARTVNQKC
jgi:hypothetical protein